MTRRFFEKFLVEKEVGTERGHISWNCAQGTPFTCIQGEWCLQDNCRAAAAVSLILASFHKILRILGGRSFSIPKLNLVSRDHRR